MDAARVARMALVASGIALACLAAQPCRAQAEIAPDHYEDAPARGAATVSALTHRSRAVGRAAGGARLASETRNGRQDEPKFPAPNKPASAPPPNSTVDPKRPDAVSIPANGRDDDICSVEERP